MFTKDTRAGITQSALLAVILALGAPVHAQQDDEDAAQADADQGDADGTPDTDDDDVANDAKDDDDDANDAAGEPNDADDNDPSAADDRGDASVSAQHAAADDNDDAGDGTDGNDDVEDGPDEHVVPIQAWDPIPMREDEVWAPQLHTDPANYNIPVDKELNPTGDDWLAVDAGGPAVRASAGIGTASSAGNSSAATNTVTRPAAGAAASSPGVPARAKGTATARFGVAKERPAHLANSEDMPIVMRPDPSKPRPAVSSQGAGAIANDKDTSYSTGGQPVRAYGAPWQAQIYFPRYTPQFDAELKKGVLLWQAQHYCGGTLIANDWVLTAAHCIDESMVQAGYRVRLGLTDISKDDGTSYKIERIVRHSRYADESLPLEPNRYKNDIALIRIVADEKTKPRDPEKIRPIPIDAKPVPDGTEVAATGWGKTQPVDKHAPNAVLMRVVLQVMGTDRCRELPGYGPQRVPDEIICAADQKKSTCRGDSGGALTLATGAPSVVGIVSWGKARCSGDGNPAGYTRVASYAGWIKQAMALDRSKNKLP